MSRNTGTGAVLEQMILPALRRGNYQYDRQVHIGQRPGGKGHYVDVIAVKDTVLILVSTKWQEVGGTAEQKVPFEVICLIEALKSGHYKTAYLVLAGTGWTLKDFYIGGGLTPYIRDAEKVKIIGLEAFIALANEGRL